MNENERKQNHDLMVERLNENEFFLSPFTKGIVNLAIDLVWENPNPNGLFTEADISQNVDAEIPRSEIDSSLSQGVRYGYFSRVGNAENPDIYHLNAPCCFKTVKSPEGKGE